ncbi:MAG: DUF302 domain-containing protein [Pseudomonadota bacterium]
MSRLAMVALSAALLVPPAFAQDGMVALPSAHSTAASLDRLETIAKTRDLKIFARIDHAGGARSVGQTLRPTELMIFGHPKAGTPLLQCAQGYGLELPLRVLAWEDAQGKSWLGYKDPASYAISPASPECEAAFKRVMGTLDTLVREAARQ